MRPLLAFFNGLFTLIRHSKRTFDGPFFYYQNTFETCTYCLPIPALQSVLDVIKALKALNCINNKKSKIRISMARVDTREVLRN